MSLLIIVTWVIYIMAESIFKFQQIMAINMFTLGLLYPLRPVGLRVSPKAPRAGQRSRPARSRSETVPEPEFVGRRLEIDR